MCLNACSWLTGSIFPLLQNLVCSWWGYLGQMEIFWHTVPVSHVFRSSICFGFRVPLVPKGRFYIPSNRHLVESHSFVQLFPNSSFNAFHWGSSIMTSVFKLFQNLVVSGPLINLDYACYQGTTFPSLLADHQEPQFRIQGSITTLVFDMHRPR